MADAIAWLHPLPNATRLSFCGAESAQDAAAAALGLPSSATACRAVSAGERASLWLGPDERLLLAPGAEHQQLLTGLEAALAGHALLVWTSASASWPSKCAGRTLPCC
jgi:sarcosine oxidase subunit gamma